MDTRSSSGSRSTVPSLESQPQQPTYTTVGSVAKPQSNTPLQPPVRRGRAMRWPPAVAADLAAFNQSLLANLPRGRPRSPPTTASTLQHYAPLQQNSDRAIDPAIGQINNKYTPAFPFMSMALAHLEPQSDMVRDKENVPDDKTASAQSEDKKDAEDEEDQDLMSNYSVKTLTNLASYPNPHQKRAQRALDRARETFKAAAAAAAAAAATATSATETSHSSPKELDGAGGLISSTTWGLGKVDAEYYYRLPRLGHLESSSRPSVLSSGPGAPPPLTAGPPGQRQYKASTLKGPMKALHASAQNTSSQSINDLLLDTDDIPTFTLAEPPDVSMTTSALSPPEEVKQTPWGAYKSPFRIAPQYRDSEKPNTWTNSIHETKTIDELQAYYDGNVPPEYDFTKYTFTPSHGADLMAQLHPIDPRMQFDDETRRKKDVQHRAAFYAGAAELTKTWDERLNELFQKLSRQELGLDDHNEVDIAEMEAIYGTEQVGKPKSFPIEVFNHWQTHEAADPLVAMAYSTLARNYWDNGRLLGFPTGFTAVEQPENDDLWARTMPLETDNISRIRENPTRIRFGDSSLDF